MTCPKCQKSIPIVDAIACPYCAANLTLSSAEIAKILGFTGEEDHAEKTKACQIKFWEVSRLIENSANQPVRKAYYEVMLADIERAAKALQLELVSTGHDDMKASSTRPETRSYNDRTPSANTAQEPKELSSTARTQQAGSLSQGGSSPKFARIQNIMKRPSVVNSFKGVAVALFWIMVALIAIHDESRKRIGCFFGYEGSCSSLGELFYQHASSPADKKKAQDFFEKGCKNKEKAGCQELEKMKAKGEYSVDTSSIAVGPGTTGNHAQKFCETPGLEACKEAERILELVNILDGLKSKWQKIAIDLETAKTLDEFEVALYALSQFRQSNEGNVKEWAKNNGYPNVMDARARIEAEDMMKDLEEAMEKAFPKVRLNAAFDRSRQFFKDPRYAEKMLKWMESPELREIWGTLP